MTENEMAAIAAGLWFPMPFNLNRPNDATTQAPNMHDPANLWKAVENLWEWGIDVVTGAYNADGRMTYVTIDASIPSSSSATSPDEYVGRGGKTAADNFIAALVALYKAKHS